MTGPIYLYYKLTAMYTNHRNYVKSRDDLQLQGTQQPLATIKGGNCYPRDVNGANDTIIYPCGYVAGTVFTDRFTMCLQVAGSAGCTPLALANTSISWPSDRAAKFAVPTTYAATSLFSGSLSNPAQPMFANTVLGLI